MALDQLQQSSVARGAYAPVQIGSSQVAQVNAPGSAPVAQVGAPPTPQAYFDALQKSFAPQFQQAQQQLNAQQQAMGTLTSGAGNYGDQLLTAQNNATLAGAEAPLIQQGFGQQFAANQQNAGAQNTQNLADQGYQYGANSANAGAQNSALFANQGATNNYLTDLQNQYFQGGQSALDRNMAGQEFNSTAANNLQLANLGYGNSNYQQQVGLLGGLESQGLGGQLGTTANGQNAQDAAYLGTQNMVNPYLQQIGAAAGIPTAANPYGSFSSNPGATPSTRSSDPYASNWDFASAYSAGAPSTDSGQASGQYQDF